MNNQENKKWRTIQIAAMVLYRYFKPVKIEKGNTSLYDLLVTLNENTGLRFGVIVRNSTFKSSDSYQSAVDGLKDYNYDILENRVPVLLLCVNENKETATFGFLISWQFGTPRIYRDFEMKQLTLDNAEKAINIIKAMGEVIRALDEKDFNILKRISFSKQYRNNRTLYGEAIYLRKFTPDYRMQQKEIVDEKEKLKRLFNGIPEEEYPSDIIDFIIKDTLKKEYPDAEIKSSLLLLSTDLRNLQRYNQYKIYKENIIVSPDLKELNLPIRPILNKNIFPTIPIEIYVQKEFDQGLPNNRFECYYPFEDWVSKNGEINKLLPTIKLLSEYLELKEYMLV